MFGGVACDGASLWLSGGCLPDGSAVTLAARIDVRTGQATALPPLGSGRVTPAVHVLDGTLTVAAGNASVQPSSLVGSVEQLREGVWTATGVPDAVESLQSGAVASAVLPSGMSIDGVATEGERLVLAGLVSADDAGADTYVFDPATGAWQAVRERFSAGKMVYGGATVLNDALYVLGEDVLSGSTVFKRLALEAAPEPTPPTPPVSPTTPVSPENGAGADPKALVRTGDVVPLASTAILGVIAIACGTLAFAHRRRR